MLSERASTELSGLRLNPAGVELGLKDELGLLEFELLGLELELLEIGLFGLNECTATGGIVTDVDAVADSGDVVGFGPVNTTFISPFKVHLRRSSFDLFKTAQCVIRFLSK
ncbi:hypothetical protein AGMMS49936_03580 [Endomicrobiia bacterium]|nr:hypothetical protein AGMMS49936_03580 [Endomicrobiia bacterium]